MGKKNIDYLYKLPTAAKYDTIGWVQRHFRAISNPVTEFERAYVGLVRAWLVYADAHENEYESKIGDDYVLGPEWAKIGAALRGLLNGNTGELDAGTLDALYVSVLGDQGFDAEQL